MGVSGPECWYFHTDTDMEFTMDMSQAWNVGILILTGTRVYEWLTLVSNVGIPILTQMQRCMSGCFRH